MAAVCRDNPTGEDIDEFVVKNVKWDEDATTPILSVLGKRNIAHSRVECRGTIRS